MDNRNYSSDNIREVPILIKVNLICGCLFSQREVDKYLNWGGLDRNRAERTFQFNTIVQLDMSKLLEATIRVKWTI